MLSVYACCSVCFFSLLERNFQELVVIMVSCLLVHLYSSPIFILLCVSTAWQKFKTSPVYELPHACCTSGWPYFHRNIYGF